MSENDLIFWSQNFQLQVIHFQGIPDKQNRSSASSNTNMQYQFHHEVKTTKNKYKIKINKIEVFSFFNTKKSWLRRRDATKEENLYKLLKHEQGHFDLAEECARKINLQMNKFSGKSYSCKSTQKEKAIDEIKQMLDKKFKAYALVLKKAHKQYDEDTNHGTIEFMQNKYNTKFAELHN